jgi:hypothetical protein
MLVSGNFNMVEKPQDKSTLCSRLVSAGEEFIWQTFKASLHLINTFNYSNKLKFTWDNRHRDGSRILGILDCHYVLALPGASLYDATRNYTIRGDCPASNHLPVSIELVL